MSRSHGALQHALTRVTYLTRLIKPCEDAGVTISAAVQFETARVLWDQGEMSTSIKMLQDLVKNPEITPQSIKVGRPELFARLVSKTTFFA
jgi:ataxia telangiectasia mutated family protein